MKAALLLFVGILITLQAKSQNKIIDPLRPIANFEFSYSPINNNLIVTVLLNSVENTQTVPNTSPLNFKGAIEGLMNWETATATLAEKVLVGTFTPSPSNPFVYTAQIMDGTGAFIFTPSKKAKAWKSIEKFKIKYEIDGKYNEFPTTTVYPPAIASSGQNRAIKILNKAMIIGKNKAQISIESEPVGTPFEVTNVIINKVAKGEQTQVKVDNPEAIKFANNGKIDFPFESGVDFGDLTATYTADVTVKLIGREDILTAKSGDLIFIDGGPLVIKDREPDYSIQIANQNEFLDKLNIIGKGDLGVKFATREYSEVIKHNITNVGTLYTISLSRLNQLPDDSFSFFYYTNNGREISGPYLITKKGPILSDFKFNGVEQKKLSMEFKLPSYVDENKISVEMANKNDEKISIAGNVVIKRPTEKNPNFVVTIPNEVSNLIGNDTIRDIKFNIKYNDKPIYSLGVKLFNQTILNQQIAALVSVTAEKKNNRDKDQIAAILGNIVKIGKAVGNSVQDAEVQTAIDGLKNGDKDKVKNIMSDVGKWAAIVGKVVLDIII